MLLLLLGCGRPEQPIPGSATSHLLTVDQLIAPDFVVSAAAHRVAAAAAAQLAGVPLTDLGSAGFQDAGAVQFFRAPARLGQANGPVQLSDTVVVVARASGATALLRQVAEALNGVRGAQAISTGTVGDGAHATTRTVTWRGVELVEITVAWRVDNLLNLLVVRGRFGGTRPDDAFLLAHRQTTAELAGAPSG